jgi:predicted ArsR family transcriptional regulator
MRNLDVLAHPTRLRVLRHLAEHGPAGATALADAAGVHRNTIRRHLRALEQAGVLVAAAQAARGRGRPVVEYRLADEAEAGETDFRRLAELLVTALARLRPDDDQLRYTGEDWGRYLVGRPGAHEPRERLDAVLAELGFRVGGDERTVEVSACPCPIVAPDRPEMVCRLVSGVVAGALAASGSSLRPAAEQHDPATRCCVVHLA